MDGKALQVLEQILVFEQKRPMLNMAPRQILESSGHSAGLRLPVGRDHVSVSLAQCLARGRSSRNVCHTGSGGTNGDRRERIMS